MCACERADTVSAHNDVANLFRVRFRLGHFDPPGPLDSIPRTTVADDYAVKLSLDGTTQSSVLLKNANHTLPWDRSKIGTVAVIGPTIHNSASDAGYYGPHHTQFYPKFPGVEEAVQAFGRVKTVTALVMSRMHACPCILTVQRFRFLSVDATGRPQC